MLKHCRRAGGHEPACQARQPPRLACCRPGLPGGGLAPHASRARPWLHATWQDGGAHVVRVVQAGRLALRDLVWPVGQGAGHVCHLPRRVVDGDQVGLEGRGGQLALLRAKLQGERGCCAGHSPVCVRELIGQAIECVCKGLDMDIAGHVIA